MFKKAVDPKLIFNLIPILHKINHSRKDFGAHEVLENKPGYIEVKDTGCYPDGVLRGIILGILGIFKIRAASKENIKDGNARIHKIKYAH